jgi:hypothetical protein
MNLVFSIALMIAMFAFVAGIVLASFFNVQFGSLAQWFAKRFEAGEKARREKTESDLGGLANRLLQVGTALGLSLAITFGLLRPIRVPIHAI